MNALPSNKSHPILPSGIHISPESFDAIVTGSGTYAVQVAGEPDYPAFWETFAVDDEGRREVRCIATESNGEPGTRRFYLHAAPGSTVEGLP